MEDINIAIAEHIINQANKPIWFSLENPVKPFVGRISELSELKWGQMDNSITVITGPRGIGKTEITRKYAQEVKHDNISNIIWLDASTHDSLINSFKDLVIYIGNSLENKSITSIIRETFEFFHNRRCLFIFDHASSDNIIIQNLRSFHGGAKKISVIITSRDEDWGKGKKIMKLNPFTKDQSVEYLKVVLRKEINMQVLDSSAERVSELLKYLPLALSKAVAYIVQKNTLKVDGEYTVDEYIQDLINHQLPTETTTTTEAVPPDDVLEETILDKIKQEGSRIGSQIKNEAANAWETISDESHRFGTSVAKEAENTGQKISEETARWESQVRDLFG